MELTIKGKVYQFKAGIGFMYKANKLDTVTDANGHKSHTGLNYMVAGLFDFDIEQLVTALDLMNEGQSPRITRVELEEYIEDEGTDIEELFDKVINFFEKSNCTKKTVHKIQKLVKAQKEREDLLKGILTDSMNPSQSTALDS